MHNKWQDFVESWMLDEERTAHCCHFGNSYLWTFYSPDAHKFLRFGTFSELQMYISKEKHDAT